MSDCNVCIVGSDCDGVCSVFERTNVKKSRKPYKCSECHREIPIGSPYENTFTVFEGEAQTFKTCIACQDIRDTFRCESETGIIPGPGSLWEDIAESDFLQNLTTGCIAKLSTVEGKKYLIERWQKWKGLNP